MIFDYFHEEKDAKGVRQGAICKEDVVGPFAMRMPEASNKGSQPYRKAFRFFEMAGKDEPHTRNLAVGKGHTQPMSPTIKAG